MRILGTILAGLLGLAFGSFLNVCLTRWPAGESVIKPRSHCRTCGRTLAWWENIPVLSWLALRGRCRTCGTWISARYVIVEATVGALWAFVAWQFLGLALATDVPAASPFLHYSRYSSLAATLGEMLFFWLLIALAALDAEHLWLPDWLTFPGILLGFLLEVAVATSSSSDGPQPNLTSVVLFQASGIILAAGLLVVIRWLYWIIRRKEGIGFGDVKLMAMLAAWLGLPGALLAFGIGVIAAALVAIGLLFFPRQQGEQWSTLKLPLGTFLCLGGIISSLWGQQILELYLHWAGV